MVRPLTGLISTHFCLKFNIAGVGGGRLTVLAISQARSQHLLPPSWVYLICNRNYSVACWLRLCVFNRSKLQRIVCVTSWCTRKEAGNPKTVEWLLKPVAMAGFIHDMALMESILMESGLCYTVVRPPILNNSKHGKLLGRLYISVIRKLLRQVFTNDGVRLGSYWIKLTTPHIATSLSSYSQLDCRSQSCCVFRASWSLALCNWTTHGTLQVC